MKKILYIVPHRPGRSPGQRFRFEQYFGFLKNNGYDYEISYIINESDDADFYSKSKYFQKFRILLKSFFHRLKDLKRASDFDIIFIYREAFMLGTTFFERRLRKSKAKIILDFDDAIWLNDVSEGNNNLAWLKNSMKTSEIAGLSDMVFVGNSFLADFALRNNQNVKIVPTTIDTSVYKKISKIKKDNRICIGWTGSLTTMKHLQLAVPFLKKIKEKYGDKVYFKVISDIPFYSDEVEFNFSKWSKEKEIADLCEFDIGIMPLPDDEWAKGKCGFKGLQYMALEIPAIMSPVGVNTEIIENCVNGYLACENEEWVKKLSLLIDSEELRKKFGANGRKTVEEKYSFESQKNKYLSYFGELVK
ncbi:MAG: glycosyltransferase family 4 protein [Bacteroidales bacterium]|nr:glycosyltransferase family 4 protein [Bacteroidales bacterium]